MNGGDQPSSNCEPHLKFIFLLHTSYIFFFVHSDKCNKYNIIFIQYFRASR